MGVKNLSSFIDNIQGSRKYHKLNDTKLVIDANNLMRKLYIQYNSRYRRKDFLYGGNYTSYALFFKQFFDSLKKCRITPVMIFDGGLNIELKDDRFKKYKVLFNRSKRISNSSHSTNDPIFPHLLRDTFDSVIRELNICSLQTRFDADLDSAKLANRLKCPLLSDDSDFLALDIEFGVISILSLQWDRPQRFRNQTRSQSENYFIKCLIYKIDEFFDKFYGLKKELLPIFATLLGNDFIKETVFSAFIRKIPSYLTIRVQVYKNNEKFDSINRLLVWLSQTFENDRQAVEYLKEHLKRKNKSLAIDLFELSISKYKTGGNETYLSQLFDRFEYLKSENYNLIDLQELDIFKPEPRLPDWFLLELHCDSRLSHHLMNFIETKFHLLKPQIEDFSLPSTYDCCRDLLGFICGLLRLEKNDSNSINFMSRNGTEIEEIVIKPEHHFNEGLEELPILTEIRHFSHDYRRKLLLNLLNSSEEKICILSKNFKESNLNIEEDFEFWSYSVLVINYWKSKSFNENPLPLINALVLSIIYFKYCEKFREENFDVLTKLKKDNFDLKIVHFYCEFQTCVSFIDKLSSLLKHPLSRGQLHKYLNGFLIYNLCQMYERNNFISFKTKSLDLIHKILMKNLS
jgi:hypothetical protein